MAPSHTKSLISFNILLLTIIVHELIATGVILSIFVRYALRCRSVGNDKFTVNTKLTNSTQNPSKTTSKNTPTKDYNSNSIHLNETEYNINSVHHNARKVALSARMIITLQLINDINTGTDADIIDDIVSAQTQSLPTKGRDIISTDEPMPTPTNGMDEPIHAMTKPTNDTFYEPIQSPTKFTIYTSIPSQTNDTPRKTVKNSTNVTTYESLSSLTYDTPHKRFPPSTYTATHAPRLRAIYATTAPISSQSCIYKCKPGFSHIRRLALKTGISHHCIIYFVKVLSFRSTEAMEIIART